jgi:hypothetical protein
MGDSLRVQSIVLSGLFLAVAAVGFVLTSFYRETSRTTTFVIPADITGCEHDGDCGVADQIGCCPCEAGGGQGAVNLRMRARLKGFLRRACGHRPACVNVAACRSDLRPMCVDGSCALVAASALASAGHAVPARPR